MNGSSSRAHHEALQHVARHGVRRDAEHDQRVQAVEGALQAEHDRPPLRRIRIGIGEVRETVRQGRFAVHGDAVARAAPSASARWPGPLRRAARQSSNAASVAQSHRSIRLSQFGRWRMTSTQQTCPRATGNPRRDAKERHGSFLRLIRQRSTVEHGATRIAARRRAGRRGTHGAFPYEEDARNAISHPPREPRRTAWLRRGSARCVLGAAPALAQNPASDPGSAAAASGGARVRRRRRPAPRRPSRPCSRRPAGRADGPDRRAGQARAVPAGMDEGLRQGSGQQREICYTTRDFVSDQGQPVLAVAVYDVKGAQAQKIVRFLMPLGLLLQPGIRFAVDQGAADPGRYAICFPNGCFAEAPVKDDFIAAMKKGTTLNVSVQNQSGREVTFAVPLAGFGKAFDGAPIDPKVLEEQQKKLQEELEKRSDEMRKRLESTADPGAAPAPRPLRRSPERPIRPLHASGREAGFLAGLAASVCDGRLRPVAATVVALEHVLDLRVAQRLAGMCRATGSAPRHRRRTRSPRSRRRGGRTAGPSRAGSPRGSRATIPRCWRIPGRRRRSRPGTGRPGA